MDAYLCIIAGIHDVPGKPLPGDVILADTPEQALTFAADRYGMRKAPEGSTATLTDHPRLGAKW